MARVGLSKPFYAEYTYGGTPAAISYSDGANFAKAVELSIEVDDTEPVRLYADNGVAESVSAFANGTLTLTVDDLTLAETAALLGLTTASSTTPAGTTLADLAENVPPMLGFGIVVKKIKNGTAKYMAIVLPKVQFNVPADAAVTQGETVEFATQELTATIYKTDGDTPVWRKRGEFSTEADAVTWIKGELDIT